MAGLSDGHGFVRGEKFREAVTLAQTSELINPEQPELGRVGGGFSPLASLLIAVLSGLLTAGLFAATEAFEKVW